MFESSNRTQFVLAGGLVILILSFVFSLYAIFRLEEAFFSRRSAIEGRDNFNELAKRVKDWTIVFHVNKDTLVEEPSLNEVGHDLVQAVEQVETKVARNSEQRVLFQQLKENLERLVSTQDTIDWDAYEKVDSILSEMAQVEYDRTTRQSALVVSYISKLAVVLGSAAVLAVIMIIVALKAKGRHDRDRLDVIADLKNLREKAESASQLKSQFLSIVSHEIRTPLNGIIGLSDILQHSVTNGADRSLVKSIHQSGKTLLRILNDILDFSKIEAGKFDLANYDFSIVEVLNQILLTFSAKSMEKSIHLDFDVDVRLPKSVKGDSDRISQVLFNLVGNAIKFTSKGSVIVRVKVMEKNARKILIRFSVEDTGIGISESELGILFMPFVQARKAGTSGEPGTGLGLSISRSIVHAMGGEIEVDSVPGRGSQFCFDVPFSEFSEQVIETSPRFQVMRKAEVVEQSAPLFFGDNPPKIIVAEDNPTNQVVAQTMLTQLGLESIVVSNGQEVVELLEKNAGDLILMDCQMPLMDGLEATRILRARQIHIPIVAMTANAFGDDEKACFEAGMNDFLSKPVSIRSLREKLLAHLPQARAFSPSSLEALDATVGVEGRKKVVRAFLSTVPGFYAGLERHLAADQLEELRKLGHQFKPSSETVGGSGFGQICAALEKARTLGEARELQASATAALSSLEAELQRFA